MGADRRIQPGEWDELAEALLNTIVNSGGRSRHALVGDAWTTLIGWVIAIMRDGYFAALLTLKVCIYAHS